ncbi:uncharacterized protein LOC132697385 [Cylas formicarius]|uniref:uncharacterized protein LOC132697385 n=1 Tax=Cylas formicarius TaxID=197179 RepID=UPI0029585C34|nr:uncharacterized protein LOC132697385 [Cylas formicarius]
MTILAKSFSQKKSDKLVVPLVENEQVPKAPTDEDVESQRVHRRIIIFPAQAHRVPSSTTFCLLIVALAVVSIGIVGGKFLYDEYISVTRRMPPSKFQGWAKIPISDNPDDDIDEKSVDIRDFGKWSSENMKDWQRILNRAFFQENFEIDDDKKYEKIDVPDFRNGRNGRFIHDFNTNITGIIDVTGQRCFVMPLNRGNVLPPKSLFDLVHKMWEGYYKVDTEVIRETMRVVTPPMTDKREIGVYINNECESMPIYKLEKFVSGVVKRSAMLHSEAKFAQFAGRGILELDIMNLDDVLNYEEQQKVSI